MPELPEVETIRSQLSKNLPLELIEQKESQVLSPGILITRHFHPTGDQLCQIRRHGKVLIFKFLNSGTVLSHLGMTGAWIIGDQPSRKKHTHLEWKFKNSTGAVVYWSYVDPRRFGKLYFFKSGEAQCWLDERLGPDLNSKQFTEEFLIESLKRYPNRQLKVHLLDQKLFAGSGNYIANEICALAGIRPTRRCGKVTLVEAKRIVPAARKVLDKSLKKRGLTFQGGYRDTSGNKGAALDQLVVFYQKICGICGKTPVKKIYLAQRGTYYCPQCQK